MIYKEDSDFSFKVLENLADEFLSVWSKVAN